MKRNNLLVIIVAYNSMPWAERCYDSLRRSSVPCDVITIDNGSHDGTQQFIRTRYPEVELIEQPHNIGFGAANNVGLKRVLSEGYDYAYLLNQDAWVMPDTFERLIAVATAHPDFGVLSPLQLKADATHIDAKVKDNTLRYFCPGVGDMVEDLYFGRLQPVYEVNFVMAAHWFLTRACIQQVGGFSPTFFVYGEDDNYLHRTRYWHFRVGLVPDAHAVHDRSNPVWSKQKQTMIEYYTTPLGSCSNPLKRRSVWHHIWRNLKASISRRDPENRRYALRLFRERQQIISNFRRSLQPTAFL